MSAGSMRSGTGALARLRVDPWVAVPLLAATAAGIVEYVTIKLTSPFLYNDWTRVLLGRWPPGARWVDEEMVRPLPKIAFALTEALFGSHPFPAALAYLACEVACTWLAVRLFVLIGFSCRVSMLAAAVALFSRGSVDLLAFLGLSESTVARCFTLALILEMLAPSPRRWLWVPFLVGGAISHELSIAAAPLLLLCAFLRGGSADARRLVRSRPGRELFAAWALVWGARSVVYASAIHSSHRLSAAGLGANLPFFLGESGNLLSAAVPAVLVALWLRRLPGAGEMGRAVGFGVAWAVVGYAAFWPAEGYRTHYFFNLSVLGLAIVPATLVAHLLEAGGGPFAVRLLAAAAAVIAVIRGPLEWPQRHEAAIAALVGQVRARGADAVRVIYFEDPSLATSEAPGVYRAVIADEFGENDMLEVKFPGKSFVSVAVSAELFRWYCPKPADVGVRVAADALSRFTFEPLPRCADGTAPPAFADVPGGSAAYVAFLDRARAFWVGGGGRPSDIEGALQSLSGDERRRAKAALEAIRLAASSEAPGLPRDVVRAPMSTASTRR